MSESARTSSLSVEPGEPEVLITRIFDAPRELVFQAWTDQEHLLRWFAPRGCTISYRTLDVRPGGAFLSCIRVPDGHECWCKGVYHEIAAPERIVCSFGIADAQGNSVGPADVGMDPRWPRETILTVTFDELDGKTRLTLHQTVSESLAKHTGAYPSWLDMLDRLADLVAKKEPGESLTTGRLRDSKVESYSK